MTLQRLVKGAIHDSHAAASGHVEDDVIGESLPRSQLSHPALVIAERVREVNRKPLVVKNGKRCYRRSHLRR